MTTRNPAARRVHRPSAPDDVFVAGVLETSFWAQQHRRKLVIGLAAVIVIALGLFYFFSSRAARRDQAVRELTAVRATALSGNAQLAIRDLEQYLARFGNTPSADEARLMLARAYLDAGQTQNAVETVQPLSRELDSDMGVNAAFLLAAAQETAQEPHRAEETFLRVADEARFLFQRQEALDNAARIRLQRGDAPGAAQLYERILEITPLGNNERPVFELRLGEARAAARQTGGAAGAGAAPPQAPAAPARTGN